MHRGPKRRWHLLNAAGLGFLLGVGAGVVHSVLHIVWTGHVLKEPLVHILLDYVGFIAAGVMLLVIVAEVRNRLVKAE